MIHDSGPAQGRLRRLKRRFPDAGLVGFGHSHIPLDEAGEGSARQPRLAHRPAPPATRQPRGRSIEAGRLVEVAIVPVS